MTDKYQLWIEEKRQLIDYAIELLIGGFDGNSIVS